MTFQASLNFTSVGWIQVILYVIVKLSISMTVINC